MSSFKNALKSNQKTHRERSQPSHRRKLGLLEKKKDYKERASDYQRKQNTLTALKRKALDKNPDEFYYKMVRTRMEGGVHKAEDTTPTYTDDDLKLMQTQDLKYINYRRSLELKKIDKLKASLHMIDVKEKPKNKHTVFVDSKKEADSFDAASYFDTHPALVGRAFNRPRREALQQQDLRPQLDDKALAEASVERARLYRELTNRIKREQQLNVLAQKMDTKKQLTSDRKTQKKKVVEETKTNAAVYRWAAKRKR